MNHKSLLEMARISFMLPMKNYRSMSDVLKDADQKYGKDTREYRDGLESILINYVEPQLKEPLEPL